jgi:hypothetical protein
VTVDITLESKTFTVAKLTKLTANSITDKSGIRYNDKTFDNTSNGLFQGQTSGSLDLDSGPSVTINQKKITFNVPPLSVIGVSLS